MSHLCPASVEPTCAHESWTGPAPSQPAGSGERQEQEPAVPLMCHLLLTLGPFGFQLRIICALAVAITACHLASGRCPALTPCSLEPVGPDTHGLKWGLPSYLLFHHLAVIKFIARFMVPCVILQAWPSWPAGVWEAV